jgi:hypothetical protein
MSLLVPHDQMVLPLDIGCVGPPSAFSWAASHLSGATQRGLSLQAEGGESGGLESTDNTIKLVYNHVDTARDCYLRTKDYITSVSKRPGKLEVPRPCDRRLALTTREHTSLTEVSGSFLRSKTAWSLWWTASGRVMGPRTQLWWTSERLQFVSSAEPTVHNLQLELLLQSQLRSCFGFLALRFSSDSLPTERRALDQGPSTLSACRL